MLPYISYIGTDFLRGAKGYKSLPYTPYGLKLGVEFNLIGYESGEDFVLFLIQDLIWSLFFNLLRETFQVWNRAGKITLFGPK